MLRSGPEALAWVDRELALAAERRLANRDSVQPFIDACVIAATFLEGGGVTDGRMELYATLALELINVRDKLRSRLFTPTEPGKGDKGLTGDQARFRAWAGCASIAIAADGSGVTAADHQAAMATQWLVEDDDMTARVGGPLGDGGCREGPVAHRRQCQGRQDRPVRPRHCGGRRLGPRGNPSQMVSRPAREGRTRLRAVSLGIPWKGVPRHGDVRRIRSPLLGGPPDALMRRVTNSRFGQAAAGMHAAR